MTSARSKSARHIVCVQAGLGAGGAEKIINIIARQRARAGDRITVLAFTGQPSESYFAYPSDISVRTMAADQPLNNDNTLARLRWLRATFHELKPDLIVSFLTKVNVLSLLAAMRLGIPVIVSERNNPTRQKGNPLWRLLTRATLGRADAIVMQTEAARRWLPKTAQSKARVIANPCALSSAPDPSRRNAQAVVAVGRLSDQKGFDLLIRAFQQVHLKCPDARLIIHGEGERRKHIETLIADLGLQETVRLPGATSAPLAWINDAETFVLSSRFEGFPNVLAEAMAAGMAPVAFDCPWGPSDLIDPGKTGLLVPTENVDALATAIETVLCDAALRRRLGAAAETASATRFTLESILSEWDDVLNQTMRPQHA